MPSRKTILFESLLKLLANSTIENITVEDICEDAGVSRSTFYRNFRDKYELLAFKFREYMDLLFSSKSTGDLKYLDSYFLLSLIFIKNNEYYFRKFVSYDGQNSFYNLVFDKMNKIIKSRYSKLGKLTAEIDYSVEIFACSVIHTKIKWIKEGFIEEPETIAKIIIDNMPECIKLS